jgi:DNA-binding transcriptional ArsR family regulator
MNEKKIEINDDVLEMVANWLRILSEPTRLKILHVLGDKEMKL